MNKQIAFIQSTTTQVYFNSTGYPYMCATCFGLYVSQLQAFQYKNHAKKDTARISRAFEDGRNM
jgi:hypothetical protein